MQGSTHVNSTSTTGTGTSGMWESPLNVLAVYGAISKLILSILPILAVTGFLGISASNIFSYVRGSDRHPVGCGAVHIGTHHHNGGPLPCPTIMDFLNDVYLTSTDGRLTVMSQFQAIISLVLGFTPVIYNTGLLAMFAYQGFRAYQNIGSPRGGSGGGSGGGMMGGI